MTAQGEVILQDDGTATFRTTCMLCGKPVELAGLDPDALALFLARRGPMVQDAFPQLSASEREVLVSGSHAECFEDAFPEDDADAGLGEVYPSDYDPGPECDDQGGASEIPWDAGAPDEPDYPGRFHR
jgi:hypothetical protein